MNKKRIVTAFAAAAGVAAGIFAWRKLRRKKWGTYLNRGQACDGCGLHKVIFALHSEGDGRVVHLYLCSLPACEKKLRARFSGSYIQPLSATLR